jgi:hypothetical protein
MHIFACAWLVSTNEKDLAEPFTKYAILRFTRMSNLGLSQNFVFYIYNLVGKSLKKSYLLTSETFI